ncbi:MAG: MBL fold metallo-hydrolase [bacterium]|nr:MBL fold metallo-hydrolase [bacterium]
MIFHQILSGGDRNYGYLVGCEKTKKAVVIDPSPTPQPCFEKAQELDLTVQYVVNTHAHFDHIGGNSFFKKQYNAKLVTHKISPVGDIQVADGEILELGELKLSFIHTPGHTEDSICILVEKELITGDTLFVGKVGGTGTHRSAVTEFESLKKLMNLDTETRIWPGHNYGVRPTSTIAEEKKSNPFITRLDNFDEFYWLKQNWAAYKLENGIA